MPRPSTPAVPGFGGTTSYQYGAKDQLTQEQSTRNGSYTSTFAYDGAGGVLHRAQDRPGRLGEEQTRSEEESEPVRVFH